MWVLQLFYDLFKKFALMWYWFLLFLYEKMPARSEIMRVVIYIYMPCSKFSESLFEQSPLRHMRGSGCLIIFLYTSFIINRCVKIWYFALPGFAVPFYFDIGFKDIALAAVQFFSLLGLISCFLVGWLLPLLKFRITMELIFRFVGLSSFSGVRSVFCHLVSFSGFAGVYFLLLHFSYPLLCHRLILAPVISFYSWRRKHLFLFFRSLMT